jgi:hypothetical protein
MMTGPDFGEPVSDTLPSPALLWEIEQPKEQATKQQKPNLVLNRQMMKLAVPPSL